MPYKDKATQRRYQNEWRLNRRLSWLKDNGPCVYCKSWNDLQVDHIDPSTKEDHRVWSWSQARRDVELAKCRVLCRNCHQAKTRYDQGVVDHGVTRYDRGCRCRICTDAVVSKNREWRIRTGRRKPKL